MRNLKIQRGLLAVAIAGVVIPIAFASRGLALSLSPQINAALNYPTASERFFNAGRQRFDLEIQRLRDRATDPTETLQIDEHLPATLEQRRLQLEKPEVRSQDGTSPSPLNAW